MRRIERMAGIAVVSLGLLAAGCATSKARSAELNTRLESLEQQVAVLQARVEEVSQREAGAPAEVQAGFSAKEASRSKAAPKTLSMRQVQRALASAGFYKGTIDGKQGPQTRRAIKEFQRAEGLKADGIVGAETTTALAKHLAE